MIILPSYTKVFFWPSKGDLDLEPSFISPFSEAASYGSEMLSIY